VLTVSPNAIAWERSRIPATGHYCFIALLGTDSDPAPERAEFTSWDNFVRFVRANNNVAWRNFNTETRPSRPTELGQARFEIPFLLTSADDRDVVFDVEVRPKLPHGAEAWLRVPSFLAEVLREVSPYARKQHNGAVLLPMAPFGKHVLAGVRLPAKLRAKCALEVAVPEEALKQHDYGIAVRQIYEKTEVGRLTWTLTLREPKPC
jgi:hypothetical protein